MASLNDSQETCLNCGAELVEGSLFCHQCGQKRGPRRVTVWELISEFYFSVVQVDGKFLLTLRYLLFRPGFLTKEYRAGRKVRYLRPLTLTTILAGVFFVMLEWSTASAPDSLSDLGLEPGETVTVNLGPGVAIDMTAEDLAALSNTSYEERLEILEERAVELGQVQEFFGERALRIVGDGGLARFQQGMFRMASRALVLLIPAFGFIVILLNWRRNRELRPYYSETVVYSLHAHSFLFVVMSIAQVSWWGPVQVFVAALSLPLTLWYTAASMRTSFGTSWLGSTLRALFALATQLILILIVTVLASLLVVAIV
ncbi:MAG: DUF3667 domain-containing protein [Planctomycetota bacterium]